MASNLATESKSSLADKLQKLRAAKSNLTEKYATNAKKTAHTAFAIGGGALGGYVQQKWGDKELLGVNAGLAAGSAAAIVGIMGWGGEFSETMGAIGTGMLAYEAGRRVAEGGK